jgi:arginyl-tRNA synthetase
MVKGMSTRKGTVVFLEDILEESKAVMHEVMHKNPEKYAKIENPEKVSDIIGTLFIYHYCLKSHIVQAFPL